jgi:OmcA/MtrC family decaheme c-type cytochrome
MAAASVPGNNSAGNPNALFPVLQGNGASVVTVASPPKFNFAVLYSDGTPVKNLTLNGNTVTDPATNTAVVCNNISAAIAKLDRDPNGDEPDQWVNYIYRTEAGTAGVGPGGVVQHPNAKQATTDGKGSSTLTFNDLGNGTGYWTYQFTTDIKAAVDPKDGTTLLFDPAKTHRAALQLCFQDKDGSIQRVNPYYDFTLVSDGTANGYKSVALTNAATQSRVMVVKESCNECHNKLALHGGGRVDPQFCVMCHNSRTQDANSGNILDFRTMVHKIHSGRRLASTTNGAAYDYSIWGYQDGLTDFAEVGFPQDLRNCTKCHDNSATALHPTPQGNNWKSQDSKEACLTCHKTDATSPWYNVHITTLGYSSLNAIPNHDCVGCHNDVLQGVNSGVVHWNQNEENQTKYKVVIDSASYSSSTRKVTVQYHVDDKTNGNAKWNLNADCTGAVGANGLPACNSNNRLGNLRLYVAYLNLCGVKAGVADFSSNNNGGSGANAYGYTGTKNASNVYTVDIPIPADTATMCAKGIARVITIGQAKEAELSVNDPAHTAPTGNPTPVSVSMQNTSKDVTNTLTPASDTTSGAGSARRTVVANDTCNLCHGTLGTGSGSNLLTTAFHGGARDIVEACVMCHDANKGSNQLGWQTVNGPPQTLNGTDTNVNESWQFKRLIHGIHGGAKRQYPFFHGTENFSAEVAFPGIIGDCKTCHVESAPGIGAYERLDLIGGTGAFSGLAQLGTLVNKAGQTDPMMWEVISPTASACSACHDSLAARTHMMNLGGAVFGSATNAPFVPAKRTQADIYNGNVQETCDGCHGLDTGFVKVKDVHPLRTTTD